MRAWAYLIWDEGVDGTLTETGLDGLGQDGWELIFVRTAPQAYPRFYFKKLDE